MKLNLPYPLTPEYAPFYAQNTVETMKKFDIYLDYSPASVRQVDEIIERFRVGGHTPESVGGAVLGLGCYIGQVLVMSAVGVWKKADETPIGEIGAGWSIVLELPDGSVCNPIGKAFKRLVNGEEDSVAPFVDWMIQTARQKRGKLNS
jgi:hypothetical protein